MQVDRYGTHRVLEPSGSLPQAAWRLDNDMSRVFEGEVLIDVETLNIDSASFRQMEEAHEPGESPAAGVERLLLETVRARGKQHNPVTGSGGMLVGRVAGLGAGATGVTVGEHIATLCSLTLTPLSIAAIHRVHLSAHQIDVSGQAILFASSPFAPLPRGPQALAQRVALAALDVAGAAPQTSRLVKPGDRVVVLGCGGKSGLLVAAAARLAGAAVIVGVEADARAAEAARRLGACDVVLAGDARDAVAVARSVTAAAGGGLANLTVSCVNVAEAEMAAILSTRDGGTIYFFSMATSFTRAALGAEGVSRDVAMLIGNGYCRGHAEATLALVTGDATLRAIFEERYGGETAAAPGSPR